MDRALAIASDFSADADLFDIEFLIARLLMPGDIEDFGLRELFGALAVQVLETRVTPESMGLLRGIAGLTTGGLSGAAMAAADRLEAAGIVAPRWSRRLAAPVRAVAFTRSAEAHLAVLMGSFERGGEIHGFLVCVDLRDGVAERILLLMGDEPGVSRQLAGVGLPGVTQHLSSAEFRDEVESALEHRARRDHADLHRDVVWEEAGEDDYVPHVLAATLLRAHLWASESAGVVADVGCR